MSSAPGTPLAPEERQLRDRVLQAVGEPRREDRAAALADLARLTPDALRRVVDQPLAEAIVGVLASPKRSEQRRAADAIKQLVGSSPEVSAALERALGADDPRLRWGAAYTLAGAGALSPALWPPLRETLGLEDGDQRWAAADVTCRLVAARADMLSDVRAALLDDNPVLRKMILYCLRDLGTSDLARIAYERLADPDPGVRLAALSAVSRAQPQASDAGACAEAVARLVLEDPDAGVRRAAAAALGMLGVSSPVATAALARAEASTDPSLARAAAAARERLEKRR